MSKKPKKVLISGYIGFSNFGDEAMLSVLVKYLKAKNCDITAFSSNPKETSSLYEIKSAYYKGIFGILWNILRCNVLISGGGNLIQNQTSFGSLFYYLFIILLAKTFFKKVIIFSQGIGPLKGGFSIWFTKHVLKKVDMITVRDIYSQRILSKWGIRSKYTYDALWSLDTPEYAPKNIVGVQVRDFRMFHEKFYANLAKYIDMFFSDSEIRIYMMENKRDAKSAYTLEKALKKRNMLLKTRVMTYKNHNEVIEEFSHLKCLIAMRLHANILGLKYGIKVLPISYNVKVRNLAYEFDIKHAEAAEDIQWHPLLTDLTTQEQNNAKLEDARKRGFEWSYLDTIINK